MVWPGSISSDQIYAMAWRLALFPHDPSSNLASCPLTMRMPVWMSISWMDFVGSMAVQLDLGDCIPMTGSRTQVLTSEMVLLGVQAANKADAIRKAGDVLVAAGCVAPSYVDGMLARERVMSTYLGSGIAIPHGELADLGSVYRTGVSVLQLPRGVEWEPGERAYLVIGLASTGSEHVEVLTNLVELLQVPEEITHFVHTTDPVVIVEGLTNGRSKTGWN